MWPKGGGGATPDFFFFFFIYIYINEIIKIKKNGSNVSVEVCDGDKCHACTPTPVG